jgi:hypothetical protein
MVIFLKKIENYFKKYLIQLLKNFMEKKYQNILEIQLVLQQIFQKLEKKQKLFLN